MVRKDSQQNNIARYIKQYGYAITGSIATGKSTVCKLLSELHYQTFDADGFAHSLRQKDAAGWRAIRAQPLFQHCFDACGHLQSHPLRQLIMSDPKAKELLESLLHPLIHSAFLCAVEQWLHSQKVSSQHSSPLSSPWFFYEASLIYETQAEHLFKGVIVIHCDLQDQYARLYKRDSLSLEQAKQAIAAQMPLSEKIQRADEVIYTSQRLCDVKAALLEVLKRLSCQS
ncbi:MAG: dephospho-CoA kinase [Proteobacteria bacterium]|nr:dephospho-CoA kinase [Pseudomonadota bacterium]